MTLSRKFIEGLILGGGAFLLSGGLQVVFASGRDVAADGDKRFEAILAVLYFAVFLIGLIHFRRSCWAALHTPALIGLLILACTSAAWATFPGVVLRRTIGVAGTTLFGIVMGAGLNASEQLRLLRWVFRIAAALSLAMVILSPRHGISTSLEGGGWRGIFNHKNGLGGAMALALLIEWLVPTRALLSRISKAVFLCLYCVLLVFSDSITALIAGILTFAILYAFRIFRRQYKIPLPALLGAALVIGGFFLANPGAVTGAFGRSSDITGRTELWHWVVQMIGRRPMLGYGFSGFWGGGSPEYAMIVRMIGWNPMYSHDGYLEIMLSLGVAGLLLFVWFMATGLRRAVHQAETGESVYDLWPLAFLIYFLIHNLGECTILWQNCLEWAICVAVVVGSDSVLRAPYREASAESELEYEPDPEFAPEEEYV
ncbi:MAG TPA: O-antigen ligase family protein [Candidatus Baltobacteraceae bacterium]|nr:O-antigen ligase family protein [Candidatus Baltobacteraceae bacterium]